MFENPTVRIRICIMYANLPELAANHKSACQFNILKVVPGITIYRMLYLIIVTQEKTPIGYM